MKSSSCLLWLLGPQELINFSIRSLFLNILAYSAFLANLICHFFWKLIIIRCIFWALPYCIFYNICHNVIFKMIHLNYLTSKLIQSDISIIRNSIIRESNFSVFIPLRNTILTFFTQRKSRTVLEFYLIHRYILRILVSIFITMYL